MIKGKGRCKDWRGWSKKETESIKKQIVASPSFTRNTIKTNKIWLPNIGKFINIIRRTISHLFIWCFFCMNFRVVGESAIFLAMQTGLFGYESIGFLFPPSQLSLSTVYLLCLDFFLWPYFFSPGIFEQRMLSISYICFYFFALTFIHRFHWTFAKPLGRINQITLTDINKDTNHQKIPDFIRKSKKRWKKRQNWGDQQRR